MFLQTEVAIKTLTEQGGSWVPIFCILALITTLILNLVDKQRGKISETQKQRADSNKDLLQTRELEIKQRDEKIIELEKINFEEKANCARATAERNTFAAIVVEDLAQFWQQKDVFTLERAELNQTLEDLKTAHEFETEQLRRKIEVLKNVNKT